MHSTCWAQQDRQRLAVARPSEQHRTVQLSTESSRRNTTHTHTPHLVRFKVLAVKGRHCLRPLLILFSHNLVCSQQQTKHSMKSMA